VSTHNLEKPIEGLLAALANAPAFNTMAPAGARPMVNSVTARRTWRQAGGVNRTAARASGPLRLGSPLGNLGARLAGGELPGSRVRDHGLPIGRPPGCLQHRADDPAMRPAAAQVAVQSLPYLVPGRGGTVAQQAGRGHHHAGGAVAALGGERAHSWEGPAAPTSGLRGGRIMEGQVR
jgi:hypothetical protein